MILTSLFLYRILSGPCPNPILSTALIYYSFDSSTVSGNTVTNLGSGGSTYNGQLHGNPIVTSIDKVVGSGAMSFVSSSTQYVQIPPFTATSAGVSTAFWFKFSSSVLSASRIFDFGNGNSNIDGVGVTVGQVAIMFMCTNTGNCLYFENFDTNLAVADQIWRHGVWTIDSAGNWLAYINGKLTGAYGAVSPVTTVLRNLNYLGKSNANADPYLDGWIDEFYYFESVLSAGQVLSLYQRGGTGVVYSTCIHQ